jgi:GNAT superfamily N-acetyltransferase
MDTARGALSFDALRPELLDDWLAFFDGPAFADHPEWRGCYCRCFLFGAAPDPVAAWERACASGENRSVMAERITAGQVDGLLARRDGEVLGWLHFGPVARFCSMMGTTFKSTPAEDGGRVGRPDQAAIACFLVAAPARRSGVARAMLREALDELRRRGFRSVVAWGATQDEESAGELFTGPIALYLSEGFEIVQGGRKRPTVLRAL